jgi:ribose 5-phosphate isomerase B
MSKKVIAIASDHAGVEMKAQLKETIAAYPFDVIDLGTQGADSVDYPDVANEVAKAVIGGQAQFGIAICGSGVGMSIALNRHKGIRAALCREGLTAALARRHNDANVLCLGARFTGAEIAKDCVRQFLTSEFEGGRHAKRNQKIDNLY